MWMRITGTHHGAAVFEYLNVVDFLPAAEFTKLIDPRVYDAFNLADLHCGEGEIVARRKADNTADARFTFGNNQALFVDVEPGAVGIRF